MSQTTEIHNNKPITIQKLAKDCNVRFREIQKAVETIGGINMPKDIKRTRFTDSEAEKITEYIKNNPSNYSQSDTNNHRKDNNYKKSDNKSEQVHINEIARELGRRARDMQPIIEAMGTIPMPKHIPSARFSYKEAEEILAFGKNYQPVKKESFSEQQRRTKNSNEKKEYNGEVRHIKSKKPDSETTNKKLDSDKKEPKNSDEVKEKPKATTSTSTRSNTTLRPQRTGLKIVKKSKPKVEKRIARDYPKNNIKNTLTGESLAEIAERKAEKNRLKNKKTSVQKQKKDAGNKLNIFEERDFNSDQFYEAPEEKEVVLIDFRDEMNQDFRDEHEDSASKKQKAKGKGKAKKPVGRNSNAGNNNNQRNLIRTKTKRKKRRTDDIEKEVITSVEIPEDIRVYEFAEKTNREISEIIKVLFSLGEMVTKNDFLNKDKIDILAEEFEIEVKTVDLTEEYNYTKQYEETEEEESNLLEKAPVITIMGHVDHGKTSLLDKIRDDKANIADKEAGGITQHIGAYTIEHNGKPITFIDTPGHEAFSHMRKRGSEVTDVIIIVVAGDDGVKPQTKEAIKHAKESGAPIIVAVNKMDKESANIDMVKAQVAELELTPIDWGGDTEFIPISAKSGMGIDELLENILIQAEVLELQANPDRNAYATIIESSLEKGRGPVATVIVKNGTLKVGNTVVAGGSYGRIRALLDDRKQPIKEILPGGTGVVVGLDIVPPSGEDLVATDTEKEAKELAEKRKAHERHKALSESTKSTLEDLTNKIAEGQLKNLKVILKADVHGSLEALKNTLSELRNDEVKVSLIHTGVGGITESDIVMAGDSDDTVILGFNVRPTGAVKESAKQKGVDIKTYSVIYKLIDDVTAILQGMMSPIIEEENTGQANVKQVFKLSKGMVVAGCMVSDGQVIRGGYARLIRDGVVIAETTIHTLKRFKDDVNEVKRGYECGIGLHDVTDIRENDYIETFKKVEKQAVL
jgi:translation initiation factor IF-2